MYQPKPVSPKQNKSLLILNALLALISLVSGLMALYYSQWQVEPTSNGKYHPSIHLLPSTDYEGSRETTLHPALHIRKDNWQEQDVRCVPD